MVGLGRKRMLAAVLAMSMPALALAAREPARDETVTLRMVTPEGKRVADGRMQQTVDASGLHIRLTYRFDDGRIVEESADFLQQPALSQRRWSWTERLGDVKSRSYQIDFQTGAATGFRVKDGKRQTFNEKLDVKPGKSFAGAGFVVAATQLMPELKAQGALDFRALAPTPKPRSVKVKLRRIAADGVTRGGAPVPAQRVTIHAELGLVGLVVKPPDTVLLFTDDESPTFISGEGPLLEPGDPIVRTEVVGRK